MIDVRYSYCQPAARAELHGVACVPGMGSTCTSATPHARAAPVCFTVTYLGNGGRHTGGPRDCVGRWLRVQLGEHPRALQRLLLHRVGARKELRTEQNPFHGRRSRRTCSEKERRVGIPSYETVSPRTRARRAQAVNPERGSEDAPGRVVQTAGGGCYAIVPVLVRALELHRRLVQTR